MTHPYQDLKEAAERATPFAGYTIDASGDVWSNIPWRGLPLPRKLRPHPNPHGYLTVKVRTKTGMRKAFIHKMVCEAFHGPKPSPAHEVRHLDGNRTHNHFSNLAWGTRVENAADRKLHGTEKAAENGIRSAHKLRGRYKEYCLRGHFKNGKRNCNHCLHIARAALKEKPHE